MAGTPRAAGLFRATIQLADSEGRTAALPAVFRIARRLSISTAALRPGKVGRLYRVRLAATGGLVPRSWKVVSGSLPRGMRLDLDDGHGNSIPSVRAPMLMSETPLAYHRPSPRLGEHTAEILAELEKQGE